MINFPSSPALNATYTYAGKTWIYNNTGWALQSSGVTSVTGTAPVVSSGGATPAISIPAATTSVSGYLTSTDWTTFNNKQPALGFTAENSANKDASGGYAGLTLFKLNMRNAANTFTSFFTNTNTAARTYTLKDADGTVAFTSDITGINSGTNTGDNSANTTYVNDYRAANFVAGTNYLAPSGSAAALTNFPTFNQNTTGTAASLAGGTTGAIHYQSAASTSAFLAAGTTSQVLIGGVAAPAWSNTPTLTGTNFTGIPNTGLTNSSVTIGSTSVSLGATVTTFAGLSSVTSTTFVGALSGNATSSNSSTTSTTATNIDAGTIGQVPYQTGAGATTFLAGNITTTPSFLTSTGSGVAATAPTYTTSTGSGSVVLATSPTLGGTPTTPTATPGTNTTQIASTAFVTAAVAAGGSGVTSFNTRTGAVTLTSLDVTGALTFTPYNATNPSGYITSAGTATNISGTLAVAQGGTGATTTTGTGANVLDTSPTLVTPNLGTPSALVGTNITGTASGLSIGGNAATATTLTSFTPGNLAEIGRYLDFHGASNGFDYDVRLDGQAGGVNGGGTLAITAGGGVSCNGPFIGSLTGNASTATNSNSANARWVSAAIAGSNTAQVVSVEVKNNGGTGDTNFANIGFHCTGTYGIHLGLRPDGYFCLGAWSRAAYSWYSDPSGNMVAAGNVSAYSDPRLKENIVPILGAIDIIKSLNGVRFSWRHDIKHSSAKAGKQDIGILANEVEAVLPELITDSIEIDGDSYKTVCYEKLVPVLIQAVKEQNIEIDSLKDSLKKQQDEIAILQESVKNLLSIVSGK